jgi:hypothetical protein
LAASAVLAVPAALTAQGPAPSNSGSKLGDVIIDFHGGNVGQAMADALAVLTSADGSIGTVDVVVEKGDNVCSILTKRNFPPACAAMMPSIVKLNANRGGDLGKLQPGDHLLMPDVRIEIRPVARNVTDQERRLAANRIIFRWSGLTIRNVLGQDQISYNAYRMYVPGATDEGARNTLALIKEKMANTANVTFDIALYGSVPAPLHSGQGDAAGGCATSLYRYADLLDADSGLNQFIPSPDGRRPPVYLIDTVLNPTPDLAGTSPAPATPPACVVVPFDSAKHHATLLAGIVASGNQVRFAGLAPEARITALDWVIPDPASATGISYIPSPNTALTDAFERIGDNLSLTLRPVFLAATSFPTLDQSQIDEVAGDAATRVKYAPNVPIFQQKPLLIASAGQREPSDTGPLWRISPNYAYSPQNLGDLDNVVLVTACVDCRAGQLTVLPDAFRPVKNTLSTITLVAPGGKPIPGWVDANSISSAGGTSQAAAFVAGVAAEMISRYPDPYRDAARVKYWLSATAWPLVSGIDSEEASSIVEIGIVDPQRALLDPSYAWVKDRQGTWQKLKLRRWQQSVLKVQDSGARSEEIPTSQIARIVNVAPPGTMPKYAILKKQGVDRRLERVGWRTLVGNYTIERCDGGPPVKVEQADDIILPFNRLQTSCD